MEQRPHDAADEGVDRAVALDLRAGIDLATKVSGERLLADDASADAHALAQRRHGARVAEEVEHDRWLFGRVGALQLQPADAAGAEVGGMHEEAVPGEAGGILG